jgi:hypothetical protein
MMMMKWLSLFIFLFCSQVLAADNKTFLFNEERNKFHVMTTAQAHTTNISSVASATSVENDSEFSIIAQTITGEYFLNDTFSVVGGYYFALVLDIDAEINGFDIGFQYYPFSNGTSKDISFMGSNIETSPSFSPYLYVGASTRDYQFSTVSLKFQGAEVQAGAYWHFHDKYFLKGSAFSQQHLNNNVRTLTTIGGGLTIGMKF